jgi:poly(3-hydroxybutyrate) depolymerase
MSTVKLKTLAALSLTSVILSGCGNGSHSTSSELAPKKSKSDISVSGLSSGAYMALQFHLSFSEDVIGSGLIAGGPYYCAEGNIATALKNCVSSNEDNIDIANLAKTIERYQNTQKTAKSEHNKQDKVWLLHGTLDTKISREVADKLAAQANTLFASKNIQYIKDKPFSHLMPTLNQGGNCTESSTPFIGNCNYDAAGEMLKHIARIKRDKSTKSNEQLSQQLITFKQADFADEFADTLGEQAYLFVPENCKRNEQCSIHISFHGCNQNAEAIGNTYAKNAGFNAWAQTNDLVVLYPQTKKSAFMPLNPQACWDWWGYTGENYAHKEGKQIKAIKAMVNNIPNIIAHNK